MSKHMASTTLDEQMLNRIAKVKVADLADGHQDLGLAPRVANSTLRPASPMLRLVGTAVTFRLYLNHGQTEYLEEVTQMYELGRSVPHAILVHKNEVPGFTSFGSGGARVAQSHGYAGCVVAGPIRDTQELPSIGFPIFGTSINPLSLRMYKLPYGTSVGVTPGRDVDVAGIKISSGDILVGDNDGLIAIDPQNFEQVLAEAEKICNMEARIFNLLRNGKSFRQILSLDPELQALGQPKFS
ncbi:MAG: RraA family protein [Acidobacteria bacterium]|nr:MAG: RraA family protein [Acidobacteriota bacterium]